MASSPFTIINSAPLIFILSILINLILLPENIANGQQQQERQQQQRQQQQRQLPQQRQQGQQQQRQQYPQKQQQRGELLLAENNTNIKMCPLDEHVVCNENDKEFRCVCTMFGSVDPPPEQSCTHLLNFTGHRGNSLEAISAKLRVRETTFFPKLPVNTTVSSQSADNYLEEKFKAQLAWNFKINQKNIVFLRLRCLDDGTSDVIVQFVVLRGSPPARRIVPPISKKNLVSANTVVSRLRTMRGDTRRFAGLEIVSVEKVHELLPVEVDIDNTRLVIQAIAVGLFIIMTCICGCWVSCRRRNPEDEGYSDVQQQLRGSDKV